MIGIADFSKGLLRLATATRQSVDEATYEVYYELLRDKTDPDEWEEFTIRMALSPSWAREGRAWFPQVVELVDALREFRGDPALEGEAVIAYERVITSSDYTPEGGASWSYRSVKEKCGEAAARAFLEAGGHHAFATTFDEPKRRAKFVAAYLEEGRDAPSTRLLPEGSKPKALPAGA